MIKLWQRFKEWLVIRQSAKFAKELKFIIYRKNLREIFLMIKYFLLLALLLILIMQIRNGWKWQ